MARISIPKNAGQLIRLTLIRLAQRISAKHIADGAASPLSGLDMAELAANTATADTENKNAAKLYRDAETATQNRDLALGGDSPAKGTVGYYVRAAWDVLLGICKGNEQKLGDWGFEVDASAPPPANRRRPIRNWCATGGPAYAALTNAHSNQGGTENDLRRASLSGIIES